MTHKRPDAQILPAVRACSSQRISKHLDEPVGMHSRTANRDPITQNGGKANSPYSTGWLVSRGVRFIYAEHGDVLLDIKDGRCYGLNEVAASVWVTIEGSPAGITFGRIVDVLETHFTVVRKDLEHAARDCLTELRLAGLVEEEVFGDKEAYVDCKFPASWSGAHFQQFRRKEDRTTIGTQRFVQMLETLDSLVDRVFPQGMNRAMDWRAKKLKDAIDNAPTKVNESLGHVCRQLQLRLTERQARRLFKEAAGISMKDYARKRRLVLAAKQLQDTDDAIKVIATNAGYHSYDGFCRAFYEMFQLTPVEFRRFWQQRHIAA